MTIRLIVNADDYGYTLDVSRGIRDAHLHGIVTSTTAMMNAPVVEESLRKAVQITPRLGLGVHLVLTNGRPLLPPTRLKTLVTEDGSFFKLDIFTTRLESIDPAEAKAEWQAQIEKFVAIANQKPTHLDSHHHSSYLTPGLLHAMLELAGEYDCPIRLPIAPGTDWTLGGIPTEMTTAMQTHILPLLEQFQPRRPDAFFANFYDEHATQAELLDILNHLPDGTSEIMSHPGYLSPELIANSSYNRQREREIRMLTDLIIHQTILKRRIELVTFAQL